MSRLTTLLLTILFFSAALMFAGPIPVTGEGEFGIGIPDGINTWSVFFFGSDGVNTVSVNGSASGGGAGDPFTGFLFASRFAHAPLGASINGVYFPPGFYDFGLGGGRGQITGYDSQFNVVVTEPLMSYVRVTSVSCVPFTGCEGTFAVIDNPEPSTLGLMAIALGLSVMSQRKKGQRSARALTTTEPPSAPLRT